jgi:hypothetical protein
LKYEGDDKDGLSSGNGIFYLRDGSRYEVQYHNDKANGLGILFFSNGNKYQGEF